MNRQEVYDTVVATAARKILDNKEKVLAEIFTKKLGEEWRDRLDLVSRTSRTFLSGGEEKYYLDGELIVTFFKPQFEIVGSGELVVHTPYVVA